MQNTHSRQPGNTQAEINRSGQQATTRQQPPGQQATSRSWKRQGGRFPWRLQGGGHADILIFATLTSRTVREHISIVLNRLVCGGL